MEYIKVSYSEFKSYFDSTSSIMHYLEDDNSYKLYLLNGDFKLHCIIRKLSEDATDFEEGYKLNSNIDQVNSVEVREQTPFAKPEYRTKRSATNLWVEIDPDQNGGVKTIDYILPQERYVTGGELIFKDPKEGDYITAEVNDLNSLIPEAYRAALCESHPIVARYVEKKWIKPVNGYGSFMIDTYPLNAKISAGLSLRVTYHCNTSEAGNRKIAINYHLTEKLG